ncbi:uncharacterized protein NECHADRAFT_101970 [Fusarium vanettenii 77-13-4]|uniref:C2H2-type domain-containing protein n=1 Tax=Fusarium vanettenii (strain ATCC MYA-4622 / CBS 123669 / FGSC 9596 / NRRL 45880 / 77-13-4) TaxID=660122 RepID=C7Z1H6_FUSV7|nr:uncharacterized protein NECHADRAFT_101970 [Fusarium vanettenii 77-13-4]EEU42170.1 hypothetical protein NECHADRAFT_101970 [Fusarium vanettenii 77-13-4]
MSNPPSSNAAVLSVPSTDDDSASMIIADTKVSANFPPPKTDKPRPHVCGTCQRSFARLEHLERHERSHTKEKPFECPECNRRFARRDMLLRHQQKLHQTSTPSSRPRNRRESAGGIPSGQQGDHVICQYPTYGQLYPVPQFNGVDVGSWKMDEENKWLPSIDET